MLLKKYKIAVLIAVIAMTIYFYRSPIEGFRAQLQLTYTRMPFLTKRGIYVGEAVNGIPLDIYMTWGTYDVPQGMAASIEDLKKINPEFQYYFYSDEDCLAYIEKEFDADVVNAFKTLKPGAFKADLWRYCILYKKGGVYVDSKYHSIIPLVPILKENAVIYVKDQMPGSIEPEAIYNGFIASPPGNPVMLSCITEIVETVKHRSYERNVLDVTGPCLLGRVLLRYKSQKYIDDIPFQFSNNFGPGIKYRDILILKHYPTYRLEQNQIQVGTRYGQMYAARDIYTDGNSKGSGIQVHQKSI